MTDKIAFDGIGSTVATFLAGEGVAAGQVVKMAENGRVAPCEAGARFCGLALSAEGDFAAVQVAGFAQVSCVDAGVTAGHVALTADGQGGVKKAAGSDKSGDYLVVLAGDGYATIQL